MISKIIKYLIIFLCIGSLFLSLNIFVQSPTQATSNEIGIQDNWRNEKKEQIVKIIEQIDRRSEHTQSVYGGVISNSKTKENKTLSSISYLETKPDDSKSFGYAMAVNNNFLAVGDPEANRVVIYSREASDSWRRLYEIYPPDNSLAKKIKYGFSYDLALHNNLLVIYFYDYKDRRNYLPGNKKTLDQSIYLTNLNLNSSLFIKEIYNSKMDLYFNGLHFVDNQIALVARTKGFFGRYSTQIFVIDPQTAKTVKKIKIQDSKYDNLSRYELAIGSDSKSIVISPRKSLLKDNPLLRILNNGRLENIFLNQKTIDSVSIFKSPISLNSIYLSEDLLVIGSLGGEFSQTMFWTNSSQPSLINSINRSYSVNINNYDVLFSVSRFYRTFGREKSDYIFMQINSDKTITESKIKWSCGNNIATNYKTTGLIDSDNLLLSFYGDVVSIPIKKLSNFQIIKHSNC